MLRQYNKKEEKIVRDRMPENQTPREERYKEFFENHAEITWSEAVTLVNIGLDHDFYTDVTQITLPDKLTVLVNKFRQLPMDYVPTDLERINPEYAEGELMLRHEAKVAFEAMCLHAAQENIMLRAVSTFRSYAYQSEVYYRKRQQEMPLEQYRKERDKVSARAGFSEHQTGLAVDINDLEQTFEATPECRWLVQNAVQYGFILRYPRGKEWITGYDYEPWHYRFLGKELAEKVNLSGLTYDEYYVRYLD